MKTSVLVGIVAFIAVSTVVYTANSEMKVVRFKNQSIAVHQENTSIKHTNVDINIKGSNINHKKNTKLSNSDINFNNTEVKSENNDILNITNNNETIFENLNIEAENRSLQRNIYKYQDIDWSTWKSNFINKFLEDSMYISSLDNYTPGNWFYYSFNVTHNGAIKNIYVFSFTLSLQDKIKIEQLIKSYEYQDITVFPANSKRRSVKLKAIVLLGENEQKANPYNFNDTERIKIKY